MKHHNDAIYTGNSALRYLVLLIVLSLTACAENSGTSDLERFVAETKRASAPPLEPLPVIPPTEAYEYSASEEGNPFAISNVMPKKKEVPKATPLIADVNRPREVLEYFPLDSMKMVGTLRQGDELWAMIVAPDGTIHRARRGNFIGTNLGEIQQVIEDQIVVEETFESDEGTWEKRQVSVALPE